MKFKRRQSVIIGIGLAIIVALLLLSFSFYRRYQADSIVLDEIPMGWTADKSVFWGKVTDESGQPIGGVYITLGSHWTTTGDDGGFLIRDIVPGYYRISFSKSDKYLYRKEGFGSVPVRRGSSTASNFTLVNEPPAAAKCSPPAVSITSPAAGSYLYGTNAITLAVTTKDCAIDRTEISIDNQVRFSADSNTVASNHNNFELDTKTVVDGRHVLKATVWDTQNNKAGSAEVSVNIDNTPPAASITKPANNSTLSGSTVVEVNAADNIGLEKVELYRDDNKLIGAKTSAPFSFLWDTTKESNGSHSLFARAYDKAGLNSRSANTLTVNLNNAPLTVNITSPANNSTIAAGNTNITANTSGGSGIGFVEFYYNKDANKDVLIGKDTAAPFSVSWNAGTPHGLGTYTLYAKAQSKSGSVVTSPIHTIVVGNAAGSPQVSITSPQNNTRARYNSTVGIAATAGGPDPITKVEFYLDDKLLSTSARAPYTASWLVKPVGFGLIWYPEHTFTLKAKVYDDKNQQATSSEIRVTGYTGMFGR